MFGGHARKVSSSGAPQFWQQFAPQQLKELLTAESGVVDFSSCTKKKDLVDMCLERKYDKRVFDRWLTKFKENKIVRQTRTAAETRDVVKETRDVVKETGKTRPVSSPSARRMIPKLNLPSSNHKVPDAMQASRNAQQELKRARPSLGVDPNTIFDTSESINDEEMDSANSTTDIRQADRLNGDRSNTNTQQHLDSTERRVKRFMKKERVPKLNIPSRQKALHGAITARREADHRLASLRQSPLKTKRDYETAAAEHCLTASLQILGEVPPRPPLRPSSTFISDDGNESVATDLTPLLPQKTKTKTPPTYCDELHQVKQTTKPSYKQPPVPPTDRTRPPPTLRVPREPRLSALQSRRPQPSPFSMPTPSTNSRTPAIVKKPSMANSAIRRRAMAEAKLVNRKPDDQVLNHCEIEQPRSQVTPQRPNIEPLSEIGEGLSSKEVAVGTWMWARVWIASALGILAVWVVCGGVSGLGGWSSAAVRAGEPIEFCSSSGVFGARCVACPVDAECVDGRARCSAYAGLTGSLHRWRCVSYKSLVYGIAAKSLPVIATHLREMDRKRGCSSGEETAQFEDVWDLFDEYVAPYAREMPEAWYVNPSLPGWGLDNVEDSKRSDLMTIWYSDLLTEQNLNKHNIVKHETREYALASFSRTRLWKCRASRLLSHSFLFSLAALFVSLTLLTLRRRLASTKAPSPSPSPPAPGAVSLARRQPRVTKQLH